MPFNQKVDFHAHFLSKTYYAYLKKYEGPKPDGFPTPKWSAESHLKLAEKMGVAFSFLSITSPNLSRADRETEIAMVHQINQEGAEIVRNHPDHFGLFAGLPLPHTDAAIEEAEYALRELKADGFGLSTHYAGIYLGDPRYDALMEVLNTHGTVVAVHPVAPAGLPAGVNENVPIPAMEFFMDTTRTFTNMAMHDVFGRYPKIKWIFPHAGAFLCILSDRLSSFSIQMRSSVDRQIPMDFKADMRHVYFDVAGFSLQKQLADLLKDVKISNLVYGSDTPYTPPVGCIALSGGLDAYAGLTDSEKEDLFTNNAVRMIPRLGGILGISADGCDITYHSHPLTGKEKRNRRIRALLAAAYGKIFG